MRTYLVTLTHGHDLAPVRGREETVMVYASNRPNAIRTARKEYKLPASSAAHDARLANPDYQE